MGPPTKSSFLPFFFFFFFREKERERERERERIVIVYDQYQNLSKLNKKHKYKTEDYKQALLDSGAELTITNDLSLFYSDTLEYLTDNAHLEFTHSLN